MLSIKNVQNTILIIGLAFFFITMLTLFHIPFFELISFIFYQIALIIIPGLALTLLCNCKAPLISTICYSYLFGYTINLCEYFIIKYFDSPIFNIILPLSILLISFYIIVRKKEEIIISFKETYSINQLITSFFLVFLLIFNILIFSLKNTNLLYSHHDILWWCHNSIALKLGCLPENVYMSGTNLYYHYFSNIPIAFFNLVSNINIKDLSFPLYSLTKTIVMVGAVDYALQVLKITNYKTRIFSFILVLLTTGLESTAILTYFHHILKRPFGFDIGYAYGILYVSMLIKQFYNGKFDLKIFIPATLFWIMCVGAKAPIASVLLILPATMCLYWLFKKQFKNAFGYGSIALFSFLLISYIFVGLGSVVDGTSSTWNLAIHSLSDYGSASVLKILCNIVIANPALTILTVISLLIIAEINKKNKGETNDNLLLLMLFITTAVGISLWISVKAIGRSEMYYGMASFIPLYFFIATIYNQFSKNINLFSDKRILTYKTLAIISLIFGVVLFSFCVPKKNGLIKTTIKNLNQIEKYIQKNKNLEPLLWLRDNSTPDSLILGDNLAVKNDGKYYFYGILTERKQYLEEDFMLARADEKLKNEILRRKIFINKVFENNQLALENLKKEKIDYIISTSEITPDFAPNDRYLELVKFNDDFKIYKVKN